MLCEAAYLDCAALPEDEGHSVHVDHHGPDVGNLLTAPSVLVLGVHREVGHARGLVAGFGQGVGAGPHVIVGAFVKGGVVGITRHGADTTSCKREGRIELFICCMHISYIFSQLEFPMEDIINSGGISIQMLFLSNSSNTLLSNYLITSKGPAFKSYFSKSTKVLSTTCTLSIKS